MIHDELVTYGVAKLAKEKGFNEGCLFYYQNGVTESDGCYNHYNMGNKNICSAPTQSLLQRWLREEKGVHITIDRDLDFNEKDYIYEWQASQRKDLGDGCYRVINENDMEFYSTYVEALEKALKYALENLV